MSWWEWVLVLAPPAPVPRGPCCRSVPVSKPSPRPPPQGATGEAEARTHGPDPPAAFAPPLRGDTLPQNQQPEAPGWLNGQGGGRERLVWGQGPSSHSFPLPFLLTDKLWFCCLSPNHKVLQYGDVEEGASPPTLESLPEQRKEDGAGVRISHLPSPVHPLSGDRVGGQPSLLPAVPVADIKALLTGKDCPHVREKGSGKQNKVRAVEAEAPSRPYLPCSPLSASTPCFPQDLYELAFSVSYDHGEAEAYLNFIAPSKREVSVWAGLSQVGQAGQGRDGQALTELAPSPVPPVDRWAECPARKSHGQ